MMLGLHKLCTLEVVARFFQHDTWTHTERMHVVSPYLKMVLMIMRPPIHNLLARVVQQNEEKLLLCLLLRLVIRGGMKS